MRNFILIVVLLSVFTASYAKSKQGPTAGAKPFKITPKVSHFIKKMHHQYHFKTTKLEWYFKHAQYLPVPIARLNAPFEAKPWSVYRAFFITPDRVKAGVKYWNKHAKTLNIVAKRYGVPANIIVAIIGIETRYGAHLGNYPEFSTLATLAFHYPKRSSFFTKELSQYLLLARSQHLATMGITGSYAGALGIPQFMPSSYRHYAVKFDGKKDIDLLHDHADAIASVANYLKKNGWKPNSPTTVHVKVKADFNPKYYNQGKKIQLSHTLAKLEKHGVIVKKKMSPQLSTALVQFDEHNDWLLFKNFKVIMTYNTSQIYAMAVCQLGSAIKQAYHHKNHG